LLLLPICLWAGLPGQVANAASAVETTGAGDASHCHSPDAFDWLLGSWESREGESVVRERWHRVSQDTLEGIGETLKGGKPIVSESLRLVQMSDGIFYIAKVNHNPLPVAFALTDCDAQGVSFENPEHDFPKRIDYRRLAKDQILVTVGDGKQKGFSIRFVRDSAEH
jgi:hypothetical protein